MCLDLRARADSAHGYVILCAQYCNLLARCVHALALFCPTFKAIITDQENSEEETTEDESYSKDALQDILEEDNITEQAEDRATTEEEQSSSPLCLQAQHAPEQ